MRARLRTWLGSLGTLIAVSVLPVIACAAPRSHALLVGVSSYPRLSERHQLAGPANDVMMFQRLLLARGVAPADVAILADGVPGAALPTRAAILGALNSLAAEVQAGDLVFVLLAGHGSQQPAAGGNEPDGLDEIFLPRDVGRWQQQAGAVENAITDDELGAAFTRLRARGAFVWAVFDTCHAGTLARDVPRAQHRNVAPGTLGIDAAVLAATQASAGSPATRSLVAPSPLAESARTGEGDYVYMYAAQSHELTPELRLPPQTADAQVHGLFSYTLHRVLSSSADLSYRQVLERVLQLYLAEGRHSPAPLYEGSALDAAAFSNAQARYLAQWPVQRQGSMLRLSAGALQGIGAESIVALIAAPAAQGERILGYAKVVNVSAGRATLTPIAYSGQPPVVIERVSAGTYGRVVDMRVDFRIRVGAAPAGGRCVTPRQPLLQALELLRRDRQLGQRILWTAPAQAADLYLCQQADRVLLLDASANADGIAASSAPGIGVSRVSAESFTARLRERIARAARVINLSRIVAANRRAAELDITLELRRSCTARQPCNQTSVKLEPASRPELRAGDRLGVELSNPRFQPIDVTVLYVDAAFGIKLLYPDAGEAPRLGPKEQQRFEIVIDANPSGFERLLVLAVPVEQLGPVTSFASLAQDSLTTFAVRGSTDPVLELLHEAAFATGAVSTARAASLRREDGSSVGISTYGWTVLPEN